MQVGFGKHADLDIRRLVLQHPDYVKWVLEQPKPSGNLATLATTIRRYIQVLDAKPFLETCSGREKKTSCTRPVARGTAYHSYGGLSVDDLYWWCATCDSYQTGAAPGTLINVSTYSEALSIVDMYDGRKSDYAEIIKEISRAKGMPKRVSAAALEAFFGP